VAIVTLICIGAAFLTKGTAFLMPGPLASAHGAVENCNACHTKTGSGNFGWLHGLVAGDSLADSKACLGCHKMNNTALNPHGATTEVLTQLTKQLTKTAAATPAPLSARAQTIAFPTAPVMAGGLYCATCHQEHKGTNFDLAKISNEQCRACHVVKFDSFDGDHPKFDNYPFKRRTPIIYDHANHFGKHFPDLLKKDASKRIPDSCGDCHNSRPDKRVMAVASFDQTCSTCHFDQITGQERVSGPKGVAFLTLPGLDVQTLREKGAAIGEWPDGSEAELTPFMKVMISRTDRGRAIIKSLDKVKLQDLSGANDEQIKAAANLAWEIKGLFYALISGKASDVLANLNPGGAKLSPSLVADLTASLPRDVVITAHQQWLPNLGTEMANRPDPGLQDAAGAAGWSSTITESRLSVTVAPEELFATGERKAPPVREAAGEPSPVRIVQAGGDGGIDPEDDLLLPGAQGGAGAPPPAAAPSAAPAAQPQAAAPRAAPAAPQPQAAAPAAAPPSAPPAAVAQSSGGGDTGGDDLLNGEGGGGGAPPAAAPESPAVANVQPDAGVPAAVPDAAPSAPAGPVVGIQSNIDPESWAEYGGWYQQDYAISYRPTGHKDKFIYSWLILTGAPAQAAKGDRGPATAVFDYLTGKDAQGSCTKCHSVDEIRGRGKMVNFSPPKGDTKLGRFTSFVHEPHLTVMEDKGCLTCHNLEKGRPYLKTYEQTNPRNFVSAFGTVKKDLCQTCHTANAARQDCLLCHKYHVDGVVTPMMNTKLPVQ
jgi:hypothetical protein